MKKILFLHTNGKSIGGIWSVHKTLAEKMISRGYEVQIGAIRNESPGSETPIDSRVKLFTINEKDVWEITHRRDVLNALKKGKFFKTFFQYLKENGQLKKDYEKMQQYIRKYNPDYIIAAHYQVLEGIPKEYLKRTVHVQHSSFRLLEEDKMNRKVLAKYENKLFCLMWLCRSTLREAQKHGYQNNRFIYNPIQFSPENVADVIQNKKIIVITRISFEKRIDLMISIVNKILEKEEFSDWNFEIYGSGEFSPETLEIFQKNPQINYFGQTSVPGEKLEKSSINLNTSIYEGFSISILEACAFGVPTVSFNFGESAHEEILNGKTGIIVEEDSSLKYQEKLENLMKNPELLYNMSVAAKNFSKQFYVDKIVDEWEILFDDIDKTYQK